MVRYVCTVSRTPVKCCTATHHTTEQLIEWHFHLEGICTVCIQVPLLAPSLIKAGFKNLMPQYLYITNILLVC